MRLPEVYRPSGISTLGAVGIALMILHLTGMVSGWAWPFLYVVLILQVLDLKIKKQSNENKR